ncbi:hypothetical protein [Asticcacaulis sp.]|uniref:hypothetical protein n=1 Tax=Asticcacaulis sp. TaxID=1872648 RepID=UPI00391BD64A
MQTDQTSAKSVTPYDIAFISVRLLAIYVFSRLLEFLAAFALLPTMDAQSRGVVFFSIAALLSVASGLWVMAGWMARQIIPATGLSSDNAGSVKVWQSVGLRLFGFYLIYGSMIRLGPWLGMIAGEASGEKVMEQGWKMGVSAILSLVLILIPHRVIKVLPNLR